jgi:hypothetical protein
LKRHLTPLSRIFRFPNAIIGLKLTRLAPHPKYLRYHPNGFSKKVRSCHFAPRAWLHAKIRALMHAMAPRVFSVFSDALKMNAMRE